MYAIDLFAGCGGLSKGFMDAGFEIIVGVDNDQATLNTFKLNHNGAIALNADLSEQDTFYKIKNIIGNRKIDVIIAGPPCQGFSLTGPRKFNDKRNKLYLAVFEMVKRCNPKAFIIENVPGMANLYNGEVKSEILNRFDALGYNVDAKVLCAADYGVPQIRKRLIFMGIRKDIGNPAFPEILFAPDNYRTCRDAISDLPPLDTTLGEEECEYETTPLTEYQKIMRKNSAKLYNHTATNHTQMVKDTIALVPEGGNYKDLPKGVSESRKFNEAWTRYHGDKPSKTIDTGHRNHFHYKYNRVPTVRENARLQSFPDNFIFTGTRTQQYRQVGNAAPPLLGYYLGKKYMILYQRRAAMVNTIDLFAGCGGLTEGFEQSGYYNAIACIEWDKAPCDTLRYNLKHKWKYSDTDKRVLQFDIQRTTELLNGWNDPDYGSSDGLDALVKAYGGSVDLIIGGPPCQAYSVAGRIRDKDGMKNDYRNYLFENYLEIVNHYKPKAFVFENVPGILSARPGNVNDLIIDIIKDKFRNAGYVLLNNLDDAIINFTEYGVPQNRHRIIILAIRRECYNNPEQLLETFYNEVLPSRKVSKVATVKDYIGDLPILTPLSVPIKVNGKTYSHSFAPENSKIKNHIPRYSSLRDIEIFKLLTKDIETGENKYVSTEALKLLYTKVTEKKSNIHKYHVIRWIEPSNTIPAHLYKDGLRHIHPDSKQARTITVREAARLQTFPDDYEFITNTAVDYKMIGNAVPPLFAKVLAESIYDLLFKVKA